MSGHTPTPWVATDHGHATTIRAEGPPQKPIAEIWENGDDRNANAAFIVEAVNSYEANTALIQKLTEALEECAEYFDNRADADCDQDGYIPNKEMQMLSVCNEALSLVRKP